MLLRFFISEWKNYGLKVAWYNLKFIKFHDWLGADRMEVWLKD